MVPLSIRGAQQCVAFTRAGGHLQSVAVCDCGFMPLAGVMPDTGRRDPVPGHPGVYVQTAAGTVVDIALVKAALDEPGPGGSHRGRRVGSRGAGQPAAVARLPRPGPGLPHLHRGAGGCRRQWRPPVLDFPQPSRVWRSSPCILGAAGFAALDLAAPVTPAGDPGLHTMLNLAVRSYGDAQHQALRLDALVTAWDAASRPDAGRLRIDAYPPGLRAVSRRGQSACRAAHDLCGFAGIGGG